MGLESGRLTFDAATHTYRVDGRVLPSVTQVLKAAGLIELGGSEESLAYARDLGIAVHAACALDDVGDLDETSVADVVKPYLEAYRRFVRESGFTPHFVEQRVWHPQNHYAGTFDILGEIDGPRGRRFWALIDRKTGVKRRATGPQLSAYQHALPAAVRLQAIGLRRYGLHLREDATYELVPYDEPGDWSVFCAALHLYRWKEST